MAPKNKQQRPYLVLTRKVNERIYIGDDIEILVVENKGDKVKIAIAAPKNVPVLRDDIKNKQHD